MVVCGCESLGGCAYHDEYGKKFEEIYTEEIVNGYLQDLERNAKKGNVLPFHWSEENIFSSDRENVIRRFSNETNGKGVYPVNKDVESYIANVLIFNYGDFPKMDEVEKYIGKEMEEAYKENPKHFDAYACFC